MTTHTLFPPFNPLLSGLVSSAQSDWDEQTIDDLVLYDIGEEFDETIYGLNMKYGELITIQGDEKGRKSTLLANLAIHFCSQLINRLKDEWMVIDTLESGMTPAAYRDFLIGNVATRMLITNEYGPCRDEWPTTKTIYDNKELAEHLKINIKWLAYGNRTPRQKEYLDKAINRLADYPLAIFGGGKNQGRTRDLKSSIQRWQQLYDGEYVHKYTDANGDEVVVDMTGKKFRIFATDHIQQYHEWDENDYVAIKKVTSGISDFVTFNPGAVVFAITQVSDNSKEQAKAGSGKKRASGGSKLAQESVTIIETDYDEDTRPNEIRIKVPTSRYAPPPQVIQQIDPSSGAFLRRAIPFRR